MLNPKIQEGEMFLTSIQKAVEEKKITSVAAENLKKMANS